MRIIRFTVENHRSLRRETELSFVSTAQADEPTFRIPSRFTSHGLLPVMGIYGANASGKSNLIDALRLLGQHVARSYNLQPGEPMPWAPWRMERGAQAPPTRMVLDFEHDDTRYQFGLTYRESGVQQEWLYRWVTSRRQLLYERDIHAEVIWQFGSALTGQKHQLAEQTRPNALFLSLAKQNNHEMLGHVAAALQSGLRFEAEIELRGTPLFLPSAPILRPENRALVRNMLAAADVGCCDFRDEEIDVEFPTQLFEMLRPEAAAVISAQVGRQKKFRRIILSHGSTDDNPVWELPLDMESRGTQILLQRINDLLLHEHGVLVIDELDTSLHPDLCAQLVRLYASASANKAGRQLLFTTHDRGLLRELRRDEVLLFDKSRNGESTLASLSDFRQVRGRDDLRALHESGAIGGIPVLSDFSHAWNPSEANG